jgi:Ni/Co efflux regulator RcnB
MRLLTTAIVLSMLASAGAASAQSGPQRPDPRHDQGRPDQSRGDQGHSDQGRGDGGYERHATKRYKANRYQPPRGYQARQWRRGDTLPASYRARAYVVDHRRYGLNAPPRGYEYVRVRDDVFLTAVATGVISAVTLQLFQ